MTRGRAPGANSGARAAWARRRTLRLTKAAPRDRDQGVDEPDTIARGVLAGGAARVVTVVATEVAREAARRHAAKGPAAVALGRTGIAALLLATLTKDEER